MCALVYPSFFVPHRTCTLSIISYSNKLCRLYCFSSSQYPSNQLPGEVGRMLMLQFAKFMFLGCQGREVCVKHSPQVWTQSLTEINWGTGRFPSPGAAAPIFGHCHWRGTRAQAKDRFMWTSLDSVYPKDLSVPCVYKTVIQRAHSNIENWAECEVTARDLVFPPVLQTLVCRTCFCVSQSWCGHRN